MIKQVHLISIIMCVCAVAALAPATAKDSQPTDEYTYLQKQISERDKWNTKRLEKEVFRQDALILPTDKTPVDILLRRSRALLEHIKASDNAPDLWSIQRQTKPFGVGPIRK